MMKTPPPIVTTCLVARWPGGRSAIKPGKYISTPDLRVYLAPTFACVEMAFIAILHLFACRSDDYNAVEQQQPGLVYQGVFLGGFLGWRVTVDAMNLWDLVKATGRRLRWLLLGWRKREADISYEMTRARRKRVSRYSVLWKSCQETMSHHKQDTSL